MKLKVRERLGSWLLTTIEFWINIFNVELLIMMGRMAANHGTDYGYKLHRLTTTVSWIKSFRITYRRYVTICVRVKFCTVSLVTIKFEPALRSRGV